MGDMGDDFRAWRKKNQDWRAGNRSKNQEVLQAAGIVFEERNNGAVLIVRHPRRADYYPGTNRWRDVETGRTRSGSPGDFIRWLRAGRRNADHG